MDLTNFVMSIIKVGDISTFMTSNCCWRAREKYCAALRYAPALKKVAQSTNTASVKGIPWWPKCLAGNVKPFNEVLPTIM